MKFMYCNRLKIDKQKHIILSVRNISSVNFKNYDFTKKILKKNKAFGFFEVLQELIKKISAGEIQGIYNDKNKANLTLILYDIALKEEYAEFRIDDSVVLPLKIIQKEWRQIEQLKNLTDKIFVFKNKYNNFFVDFKGNPSFISRITMVCNTFNIETALKLSYLEVLAITPILKMFKSEYYCININVNLQALEGVPKNIQYAVA